MGEQIYHDWQRVVTELLATGMTQTALADKCGCSQGLISQIKNGQIKGDLSTVIGSKLLGLHRYHCRIKPKGD